MATLTRAQVQELIANRPKGTEPKAVLEGLLSRGHQLEGYDPELKPEATSTPFSNPEYNAKVNSLRADYAGRGVVPNAVKSILGAINPANFVTNVAKGLSPDSGLKDEQKTAQAMATKAASGDLLKETAGDLATGAIKGLGSTILGASELAARGMEAVTRPLVNVVRPAVQSITEPVIGKLGEAPTSEEAFQNMEKTRQELTAPKNLGETIGFGAEQIAEFLFPSTIAIKGAKVAEGLNVGQKLLKLGQTMGKEALIGGAVTAAQRGNLDQEVVDTAILSGAIPVFSSVFGKVGKLITQGKHKFAEGQISKLIKPTKDSFLFGKNPSKAIIDEGIVANSFDDLTKKINTNLKGIGSEIQGKVKMADPSRVASVESLIQKNIDDFGKKVVDKNSWSAYSDKIQQLTGEFKPDIATGQLIKTADKPLNAMTAEQVWNMQKKVGKLTQWTGAVGEKEANKQLHSLYRKLGVVLDDLAPGTKDLQFRYANMLGAQKSAVARKAVAERNTDIVRILGGAALGGVVNPVGGDDILGRAGSAVAGGLALKVANSPALRTRMAQLLGKKTVTPEVLGPIVEAIAKELSSNR